MIFCNLTRAFALRGIDRPSEILVKHGISRPTITRLLRGEKGGVSYRHLEIICTILNCTPNDLFEWRPDPKNPLPENHSLQALKRTARARSLKEMINDVPMEKLDRVGAMLDELKDA
jgi:DNA-binding Xre family transcriptional regulator